MSLYTFEEICLIKNGICKHAKYHVCEDCDSDMRFCHCEIMQELFVDHIRGTCKSFDNGVEVIGQLK
jgi:hypothetical protein